LYTEHSPCLSVCFCRLTNHYVYNKPQVEVLSSGSIFRWRHCCYGYVVAWTGARGKPARVRRRAAAARCVSPYSTDSNYEGPDTAPRRRPPRRRQPRGGAGSGPVAADPGPAPPPTGNTQPSPVNNAAARPRPPPIAAKPRGAYNNQLLAASLLTVLEFNNNKQYSLLWCWSMIFGALTLLVGWQEGHPACKNWVLVCWWWRFDWSFVHVISV